MATRVRAIIEVNDSVLLIHRHKQGKEYWVFPGGGIEDADEDERTALIRECKEELGIDISVDSFYAEIEPDGQGEPHQLFYRCSIVGGTLGTGTGPEFSRNPETSGTYEIEWMNRRSFREKTVYPLKIRDRLAV